MKNILLLIFFSVGSQLMVSQTKGDLPVLDITKDYPAKKKMYLHDMADIDYVPLETSDDILLSGNVSLSAVSENYILLYEGGRGDIFVFNRTGKLYSHFNHKGQSGQEYAWIKSGTILDEENREIFVCAQSIQVYSLTGEYKRTLKINTMDNDCKVFNFDDESLLIYDEVVIEPGREDQTKSKPYRLMSKKDGSLISVLDIEFSKRYSTRSPIVKKNSWTSIDLYFAQSMYYGEDFMIADISSDTLYLLTQDRKLTPILTRKPSVHTSETKMVWTTILTTDKFMLIGLVPLNSNTKAGGGGKAPVLMYEFATDEISKMAIFDDEDIRTWRLHSSPAIGKNMTAKLVQPSDILPAYHKKQLKGNVEKLKELDEDDNPVVRIIKFK